MKKGVVVSLCTVLFLTALAHEYVLLAAKYRLQKGETLEMHLFAADGFNLQLERPFQKGLTEKFELLIKDSTIDLSGQAAGALPIVSRLVDFEGGGLVHLERAYARIALPTGKFLAYLKEDHIEGIAGRVDRSKKEQKERYTRYIKSLVQSGNRYDDTLYRKDIGQAFEIVLLQNSYRLHAGSILRAKVFFRGKPLANKIITARNRTGSEAAMTQTARTDVNGGCFFQIKRSGEWFLHATHMIRCPDPSDGDWESFWVSYSFAVD